MNKLYYEYKNLESKNVFLFLHGWGLTGKSFDKIINKLNDISYIKLDLYGFGKSGDAKEYFDAYEYAYQIFLLIKKLNIENLIIVGHSFGGRIAIILTSVFNIKVEALVLTSSAGLNRFSLCKWLKIKLYKTLKFFSKYKLINKSVLEKFGSKDLRNAEYDMKKILLNVVVQDLTYLLHLIRCRTLLVWDKTDKETPYWICKKIKKQTKQSKIILYKNGGHFVAFENVNKFSELLLKCTDNC